MVTSPDAGRRAALAKALEQLQESAGSLRAALGAVAYHRAHVAAIGTYLDALGGNLGIPEASEIGAAVSAITGTRTTDAGMTDARDALDALAREIGRLRTVADAPAEG